MHGRKAFMRPLLAAVVPSTTGRLVTDSSVWWTDRWSVPPSGRDRPRRCVDGKPTAADAL
jgi:hypothetical protein